jgi:exonuclease VII large subunit
MKFCAASTNGEDLSSQFASLNLNSTSTSLSPASTPTQAAIPILTPRSTNLPSASELASVLSALRKLREAITATARRDQFAQRAYIFNIHAAILCKDWESYAPALTALLNTIHPKTPLSSTELHEYVGYLVLDQACRQGDIAGAHETRLQYKYKDRRVELVLRALVSDNWVVFWKMKKAVDGYQRRIIEYAEQGTRVHALKCLGRGYMSAERRYVERCADRKWADLVHDGVGWELTEADRVVIKTPKGK